jgi:hypothetical protein
LWISFPAPPVILPFIPSLLIIDSRSMFMLEASLYSIVLFFVILSNIFESGYLLPPSGLLITFLSRLIILFYSTGYVWPAFWVDKLAASHAIFINFPAALLFPPAAYGWLLVSYFFSIEMPFAPTVEPNLNCGY